jgi:hypothetical protein
VKKFGEAFDKLMTPEGKKEAGITGDFKVEKPHGVKEGLSARYYTITGARVPGEVEVYITDEGKLRNETPPRKMYDSIQQLLHEMGIGH